MWSAFLGPLLFVIFMNYLALKMNSELVLFADDNHCNCKGEFMCTAKDLVAETLLELGGWFAANGLVLN